MLATSVDDLLEERFAKFVAETANIQSPVVSQSQARIDVLVVERDALRSASAILVPAEAQGTWVSNFTSNVVFPKTQQEIESETRKSEIARVLRRTGALRGSRR